MRPLSLMLVAGLTAAIAASLTGQATTGAQVVIESPTSVLFGGLANPRGIAFGPDGRLYVAEAGNAGPTVPDIGPRGRRFRIGQTARLSRIDLQGRREIVLDNLPALTNGEDELGLSDIAFLDGQLYALTTAGGYQVGDPAWDNVVLRIDFGEAGPRSTPIFNLSTYNLTTLSLARQLDPRADVPGGMPFGLAALDGALYATDGNQEQVTRITVDGQAERILQYPASNHVLTGITSGPDGALSVAEFGPFPHRDGSAHVTRLTTDGQSSIAADGLVNAIDIAFDSTGQMYVLQFAGPGYRKASSGTVVRIGPDGRRDTLVTGLNFATSIAFGPDGNLYVAVNGHRNVADEGAIVRVELSSGPPTAMDSVPLAGGSVSPR